MKWNGSHVPNQLFTQNKNWLRNSVHQKNRSTLTQACSYWRPATKHKLIILTSGQNQGLIPRHHIKGISLQILFWIMCPKLHVWVCECVHDRERDLLYFLKQAKKGDRSYSKYRNKSIIYIVRTNYSASPRAHVNVVSIIHSIADSAISNAFFSAFKFLQQSEVPWYCMT